MNFWKYSAHGNDFVVLDNRSGEIDGANHHFWKDICSRRTGVGADGVLFVENSEKYDFHMRYLNSDGGEVSMCGNGARAISHFYSSHQDIFKHELCFSTKEGVYRSFLDKESDFVSIEMTEFYDENKIEISSFYNSLDSYYANTGVPHCVYLVDDIQEIDVETEGRRIRNLEIFPDGVNVNFISKIGDKYAIRTYERGVEGETLSCGTGTTAAAHFIFKIEADESLNEMTFIARGGELKVSREGDKLFYGGKVHLIYKGQLCIN